ncbi:hypothetical protein TNCV_3470251 [Trichonephila clavipes]|nr:hypothetical protein TNCV_3470251 [Trichonephila clavipes]
MYRVCKDLLPAPGNRLTLHGRSGSGSAIYRRGPDNDRRDQTRGGKSSGSEEAGGEKNIRRRKKNVKSEKGPLTPAGLLKLVKRFEETGKLEDQPRAGRPCLKEARAPCIAVEMEAIETEAASGTSSASEAARRLGLPPSFVRNILRRIL